MIRKIDEKSGDRWARRAAAVGVSPTSPSDVTRSVAQAASGESGAGWDPYEVWMRRIDQPRRLRTNHVSARDCAVNPPLLAA